MGGEFLLLLLLIGSAVGAIGAVVVTRRVRASQWQRVILASGVFVLGLVAPCVIFFAVGTYIKSSSPQPTSFQLKGAS